MNKFLEIFRFEVKRGFSRPAIYIYWAILFLLPFAALHAAGGAFKGISIMIAGDNINLNSPYLIEKAISLFGMIGIFMVSSICSSIVFKDFNSNSLELVFSTPLKKTAYIFGRFCAAYILCLFVFTGISAGYFIGAKLPYLNASLFGPEQLSWYVFPYFSYIAFTLFFACSLFFCLSLLLRSTLINWVGVMALYLLNAAGGKLFSDVDLQTIASLIDPFGFSAQDMVSMSYTSADLNKIQTPLIGMFLINRLLWTTIATGLLVLTYFRFTFSYNIEKKRLFGRKRRKSLLEDISSDFVVNSFKFPSFNVIDNSKKVFFQLTRFELKKLFTNIYFLLIFFLSIIFLIVASSSVGKMYDTTTYPVTYQVLSVFGGSMQIFIFIVMMIFSGEMIWLDRDVKIHEIKNSYPIARWTMLMSKFVAMNVGVIAMLLVMMLTGICYQAYEGYYNFEIGLYIKFILGYGYPQFLILMVLMFFVQYLVDNKYLGYVAVVVYWVWDVYFAMTVLESKLLVYGEGVSLIYSDMNHFGFDLFPYMMYRLYWLGVALCMLIVANQFMVVQTSSGLKDRLNIFKQRFNTKVKIAFSSALAFVLIIGGFIYYNTNILNEKRTRYEVELSRVDYEKKYKRFEETPQPKITDVKVNANIYPSSGDFTAEGSYTIKNENDVLIDTLFINKSENVTELTGDRKLDLVSYDESMGTALYAVVDPLMPGESMELKFKYHGENDSFNESGENNISQKNGTFLYNTLFPSIGYNSGMELSSKRLREKHHLPERLTDRKIDDPFGIAHNFITNDADFINFDITLSTSNDQIALAPGELIKSWRENGRSYFHYKSECPMVNYYAMLSGKYECKRDKWVANDSSGREVDIAVYHHPTHTYNLDNMIEGVKMSLDTYEEMYGPYQYKQLSIAEFPRFSSYAQSFPNLIPFSEGIGFIADLRDLKEGEGLGEKVDAPFYVTAHEMAHQWWAHQVTAANVEGSQMLMEALSQYSALKTMEKKYGAENMGRFLKNELFKYVNARKNENHKERPLSLVSKSQQSIYYNKGSLVMYGLDAYLGTECIANVLKDFRNKYAFKGAPYPTSVELTSMLMEAAPDSLKYFVDDALNKITFYDIDVDSAFYKRNKDFTYNLDLDISCKKYYADGLGEEKDAECNDYVLVEAKNAKGEIVYSEFVKLKTGNNHLKLKLERKPKTVTVDPRYNLVTENIFRPEVKVEKRK